MTKVKSARFHPKCSYEIETMVLGDFKDINLAINDGTGCYEIFTLSIEKARNLSKKIKDAISKLENQ